jgi:hypothetical protein
MKEGKEWWCRHEKKRGPVMRHEKRRESRDAGMKKEEKAGDAA